MTKLSDTQAILLASAAQRANGSVLPLPGSLKPGGGATKAISVILKHKLAEERKTTDVTAIHRSAGDVCFGVFITEAGMAAVGVGNDATQKPGTKPAGLPETFDVEKAPSKIAIVVELMTRPDGATLPELIETTGWLPHTIRAALTGLRKKGHTVERTKCDGATCYRITGAA